LLAEEVGWPILVKASFGGGGRGMRVVRDPNELLSAIESARREALSAFGNGTVFLEHYVDEPRHIEIQIFGDAAGTLVHLHERECSIQRRHQKIIEEAPSPAVDADLRSAMGAAAIEAGRALGYVGAGTVEFLLAPDGRFYFLEVNTRLQVEHPVTELVTGLDLVRLQLEVAAGKPLPQAALAAPLQGHAIEARLYAEDPANGFLPAAGRLEQFDIPLGPGVRLDSGVEGGDVVSTHYDPMLAKVIAHANTREEAIARLANTLRRSRVHGLSTNRALLVGILEHEDFVSGRIDTHFLDRVPTCELMLTESSGLRSAALVAAALAQQADARSTATVLATIPSGFRNNPSTLQLREYLVDGVPAQVGYRLGRDPRFEVDGAAVPCATVRIAPDEVDLVAEGVRRRFRVTIRGDATYVDWSRGSIVLQHVSRFPEPQSQLEAGSLVAPMPGTVVRTPVAVGDVVHAGEVVLVMEAMKMEHAITAVADSIVTDLPVALGQRVDSGQVLIVLEERGAGNE
jgi:acetyl/propionyl-CoA carboxylase alpha subunit